MSETASTQDSVVCGLCRRQFSRYYCPTCNAPYCSLTCFRSEAHAECSESFYKKEIESGINTEASKTAEERMKMLELLKKFEEESTSLEDLEDEESDEEDENELSRRMQGVDIDKVPVDDLWAMLTPEERQKFLRTLGDKDSELAQVLLASEELEKSQQLPWWERPVIQDDDEASDTSSPRKQYGLEPAMAPIPTSLINTAPQGHRLCFNLAALSIAYAYVTRTLRVSPLSAVDRDSADHFEIKRLISQLVPFITERNSTTVYEDIESVKQGLWGRLGSDNVARAEYEALFQDASCLMRPDPVSLIGSEDKLKDHPHRRLVLLISDLWKIYEGRAAKVNATAQKLLYYAALALSLNSNVLKNISSELLS